MSNRIDPALSEKGDGKYLASVRLAYAEAREVQRALRLAIGIYRSGKGDTTKSPEWRTRNAYRLEEISRVTGYVQEAVTKLKEAEQARIDGRWEAKKHIQAVDKISYGAGV